MHSYGWSQTNWSGRSTGEIGGLFWRTEPPDPLFSYYGDDIGELTLDDPISFSGTICFTDGMTDAAAYFGYFNRDNQLQAFKADNADAGFPMRNMMGFAIADSSAVGYYLDVLVSASDRNGASGNCGVFTPDRRRRRFTFEYDQSANKGIGRVTVSLDGQQQSFNLTAEMRSRGRCSIASVWRSMRRGGHSVEFYLDDISYTARQAANANRKFVQQTAVEAPLST